MKTLNRLQQQLSEFNFLIEYRKGKENSAPDALSRNPVVATTNDDNAQTLGLTEGQMAKAQRADAHIQLVLAFLEKAMIAKDTKTTDWVRKVARKCFIYKNVLWAHLAAGEPVIWVPILYQRMLMEAAHAHRLAGHEGVLKTLSRLRYWWQGMAAQVD